MPHSKPPTVDALRRYYDSLGLEFEVHDVGVPGIGPGAAKAAAITASGDEDAFYAPKKSRKVRKARPKARESDDVQKDENE